MRWGPIDSSIALRAATPMQAVRDLHRRGYVRSANAVRKYRARSGVYAEPEAEVVKPFSGPHMTAGSGRTRAQNRALWKLAESKPNPREYARERAAILRGETP